MSKNGIIFGKFYPLHIGHVDFIQRASGFVDNLYIFVCSDNERDKKLFEESKMKKMPTIKDRIRFVQKTFRHQKNIKVIHMAEDGIPFYPNGWKLWSERVQEILLTNNIKIDIIFTNETQDIQNYKDNFLTLPNFEKTFDKNLEIKVIDVKRNNFHISATEIRKNPYENWFFIPKYVREFFVLKVAIIGSEHSGKTNLTHKLANYYNTTYVKEYKKEYVKEELQNKIENLQYDDYSNIAYEHNRRILKSIKNADKLTFIDTDFHSLQTFSIIQNEEKHPVIEDFVKHTNFDVLIYIEKESNIQNTTNNYNKMSKFDNILQSLLKKNNQKFMKLSYKNSISLTKNYIKSIDIINNYLKTK